jgi:hypothetical protein
MTNETLYIFVACSVEQTRFGILQKVVANLKEEQVKKSFNIDDDLVVFDNGSTVPGSQELLKENFKHVVGTQKNMGFWSALDWVLLNHKTVLNNGKDYKYVYIIESDMIHFALEKIEDCERVLNENKHVGSIKVQEYDVANSHLYNKTHQYEHSRKYAWVHHINFVTGDAVKLRLLDEHSRVYETNFLTVLPAFNRLEAVQNVFAKLRAFEGQFIEQDFQKLYYEQYPVIGLLDGGVFEAKLGYTLENGGSLSGSWSDTNAMAAVGYHDTRKDAILKIPDVITR